MNSNRWVSKSVLVITVSLNASSVPGTHRHSICSVQSPSCVRLFVTPWITACQASLSITNSRAYPNSCPSSWWCHLTISSSVVPFSSCPESLPASGSFSNESALCIRCPKYWSFSFSISPSNEHSGLISFRMDWLDLLAVWGTLKILLLGVKDLCFSFKPYLPLGRLISWIILLPSLI